MAEKRYIDNMSKHLFWDVDVHEVDLQSHALWLIQRVLEYGEIEDWKIILDYYGLDRIVNACKNMRTLDKKALSFICCLSNTQKEEYRCYHTRLLNPTLWNS